MNKTSLASNRPKAETAREALMPDKGREEFEIAKALSPPDELQANYQGTCFEREASLVAARHRRLYKSDSSNEFHDLVSRMRDALDGFDKMVTVGDRLLSLEDVAGLTTLSISTLQKHHSTDGYPKFSKVGNRLVIKASSFREWMNEVTKDAQSTYAEDTIY